MNMTMQQPISQPFYMSQPRLPIPWPSNSLHLAPPMQQQQYSLSHSFSQPSLSFAFPQQYPHSNKRHHNLKQSASYSHRRPPIHPSLNPSLKSHHHHHNSSYSGSIHSYQNRPLKTKSASRLGSTSQTIINPLSKAHSWHTMASSHQSNLSVAYAKEMNLTPKRRRKHSPQKKKRRQVPPPPPPSLPPPPALLPRPHPRRHLSASPKRRSSLNIPRRPSIRIPKCGVVRISTLDEMPVASEQAPIQKNNINPDRLSTKGSISNSTKHQKISKTKPKGNIVIKNRQNQINNEDNEEPQTDSDTQSLSSSLSNRSHILQQRLNGSLRNDPLITAAMEDYRRHRRSSLTPRRNNLRPKPIVHSSSSSSSSSPSPARSRNHSQSSFTSTERAEIREMIKKIKTNEKKPSIISLPASPFGSDESLISNTRSSIPKIKPQKSCIAEELDREFNKLRALNPDREINFVNPSSICQRKKTNEKPVENTPPLPTFDELLRQVQLRPIDKPVIKPICFKENSDIDNYENPFSSIPVPCCSPLPIEEPTETEEIMKHEYALPIKKTEKRSLPYISAFQPMRGGIKSTGSSSYTVPEKRVSRPHSMLNWFHNNVTHPLPSTFQPTRTVDIQNEYNGTTSVKENIYTSDINVYIPTLTMDKNDNEELQIHLDNQTIVTDDLYTDIPPKHTTNSSSLLTDFSHLFTRKHKPQNKFSIKNQRCSIM